MAASLELEGKPVACLVPCSRALRAPAEKHDLTGLDSTFRGLKEKDRFVCAVGHVTRISPRNLIRQWEIGCRECVLI